MKAVLDCALMPILSTIAEPSMTIPEEEDSIEFLDTSKFEDLYESFFSEDSNVIETI
jgi:hypothetical protein